MEHWAWMPRAGIEFPVQPFFKEKVKQHFVRNIIGGRADPVLEQGIDWGALRSCSWACQLNSAGTRV